MFDIHYFANINYYITLSKAKNVIFTTALPYQKGWYNNKCIIASSSGELKLSVPLVGGRNQNQLLKDVRIAYDQDWRHQHLRAIETCYGNSPFFDFYIFRFEKFFQQKFTTLIELNLAAHQLIVEILKLNENFTLQENLDEKDEVFFSKKSFLQKAINEEIEIKYEQVFENKIGFLKNLSIIDLIFCCGPQAKELLISSK